MAFAFRGRIGVDTDVKLQLPNFKPGAATTSQFLGFWKFLQAQRCAVESDAFGFQCAWHRDLHVVYC